jgi:hypothetical protein
MSGCSVCRDLKAARNNQYRRTMPPTGGQYLFAQVRLRSVGWAPRRSSLMEYTWSCFSVNNVVIENIHQTCWLRLTNDVCVRHLHLLPVFVMLLDQSPPEKLLSRPFS